MFAASKGFILATTLFALFSFYAIFHSLHQSQLKFDDTSDLHPVYNNNSLWFQPKVKVVMVIVNSMRFDYLLNAKNIDNDKALNDHKLKKFNQAFHNHPDRFVVFRALADTPTMTTLRVPSFMTGNIPQMGDILNGVFGASPAEEDSVLRQLYRQNKTSYFTGDNTLLKDSFPKYFTESNPNVSTHLNMSDWHVDEASKNYTDQKLQENSFDFLAAHLLRLDHMSHANGLGSHQTLRAIEDVDRFLVHIMHNIDENTMLLFAGDHGMTKAGTHGDGTNQETDTAIVAFYKKGFLKYKHRKNTQIAKIMKSIHETDDQIHQKDLAPTLAMLMGLPIPYSSMGQILNDLYPNGKYFPKKQKCADAAFFMQMLADNHVNTLQVWNYFKQYHEKQPGLFNETEYQDLADTFEDLETDYQDAYARLDQRQQCEHSFQKAVSQAIKQSQQLSHTIYDLVKSRPPRDLVMFWQALVTLALVVVSYVFIVQYIYKNNDYEHTVWTKLKNWKASASFTLPLALLLAFTWSYMENHDQTFMRRLTTSVLISTVWTLFALGFSFRSSKSQEEEDITFEALAETEEFSTTDVTVIVEETQKQQSAKLSSPPVTPQKPFITRQNLLVSLGAFLIVGILFSVTNHSQLEKIDIPKAYKSYVPYVFTLLAGVRLSFRYPSLYVPILLTALLLSSGLNFTKNPFFWSKKGNLTMGLLLIADWVWDEIQFARSKLRAGKVWSYQYVIPLYALVSYHLDNKAPAASQTLSSETPFSIEFFHIIPPQIVGAILVGSCLASIAWRMPRKVIKRNMQVNIVLFLVFLQFHKTILFFGIVLSLTLSLRYSFFLAHDTGITLMRGLKSLFNKSQFQNYLYPLFLGLVSYIGLFATGFTDQKLPRSFDYSFMGIPDLSIEVSIFLYGSAMLSTVILGMLFMSFHSQDLESPEVELGYEKQVSECEIAAFKGDLKIIRKRNAVFFSLFYCLVMIAAAVNQVTEKSYKKGYLAMERFLIDGAIYFFVTNVLNVLV